jgi:glycosyltransferase involved in cell wall biosynthesis
MRITLLTHYYTPEVNAPASRWSEIAREWRQLGHEVTVVTAAPSHPRGRLYPGYSNRLFQTETIEDISVIRIWTAIAANEGFARRLVGYFSYPLSLALNRWRLPSADLVISTSPQFFCGLSGWLLRRRATPWILEIRDLWPESIVSVGAMRQGPAIRLLERIERWAYRSADAVVCVTDGFVPHVAARAPDTPTAVIKNGVDLALFSAAADEAGRIRSELGLEGKFVAGYIGTHGMAHGLDTVIEAAEALRHRPDIAFLMVGEGSERARLEGEARRRGLSSIVFLGHQPKAMMPKIWQSIDAGLVLLRRADTFKTVLPSKMFETMAMDRPIVMGVEGEAAALLAQAQAGIAIQPQDAEALAAALVRLADDRGQAAALGAAGRAFVTEHFDRRKLARDYLAFAERVVAERATRC